MKEQLVRSMAALGFVLGVSMISGCVGPIGPSKLSVGSPTINNFGSGPAGKQITGNKEVEPLPETSQIILLSDQRDLLRLAMKTEGNTQDERALAGNLIGSVTASISASDAIVGKKQNNDIELIIQPKLTTIDKDGDYYRMNCSIQAQLKSIVSGRVYAAKKFQIVSKRRVLGKEAAISQFESGAVGISDWCRNELKRIADNQLCVSLLSIQLPTVKKGMSRNEAEDSRYIKEIGDNLGKMPNFVSYEFAGKDSSKGICTYRVVYFKEHYPAGIANAVSALVGSITDEK